MVVPFRNDSGIVPERSGLAGSEGRVDSPAAFALSEMRLADKVAPEHPGAVVGFPQGPVRLVRETHFSPLRYSRTPVRLPVPRGVFQVFFRRPRDVDLDFAHGGRLVHRL